ncbi:MAG: zinc ribbon domain-containing protein [Oscillospiraceae bacterium]|jgi:hypothetical protein|nr:zinc ribbon domain-containing protein [Oscillospiraceae bacterium]
MDKVNCPNCGTLLAKETLRCTNCKYPLRVKSAGGIVKIKSPNALRLRNWCVIDIDHHRLLYSGTERVAEFYIAEPTIIYIVNNSAEIAEKIISKREYQYLPNLRRKVRPGKLYALSYKPTADGKGHHTIDEVDAIYV